MPGQLDDVENHVEQSAKKIQNIYFIVFLFQLNDRNL